MESITLIGLMDLYLDLIICYRLAVVHAVGLPYYLPIAGERIIGFIPFPRVLMLYKIQTALSRIWTWFVVSISYKDVHIIIIIIMSCGLHGYPWPSLFTSPYHSLPPAGLQGHIPYHHTAAVWMSCFWLAICGGPQEYITYDLILASSIYP